MQVSTMGNFDCNWHHVAGIGWYNRSTSLLDKLSVRFKEEQFNESIIGALHRIGVD